MNAMDKSQWQTLQDMLALRQFYRQGGAGVPGMPGAQSGAGSPWDQVPGGGSTANALPPANPMVDHRARYNKLADDAHYASMLGYGTAGASMLAAPNPLSLLGALGGIGLGAAGGFANSYASDRARRLGYQGN
jgi:hypothetical protein